MNENTQKIYPFLKAVRGNWRNALFIRCQKAVCPCRQGGSGFLFCADGDGRPLLLPAEQFSQLTGEQIDPSECAALLDCTAFESAYSLWFEWNAEDPHTCACSQVGISF